MFLTRTIAVGIIVASVGLVAHTASHAQTLRNSQPPAEFPPTSFKSDQYVDSRGCVYIRAGIDGNTTWVPRVTRDRKQVCGYKPSLSKAELAKIKPDTSGPETVEQITLEPRPSPVTAPEKIAAPEPETPIKVQPKPAAKPAPQTATAPTVAPTPAPKPKPAPKPALVAEASPPSSDCSDASQLGQKHLRQKSTRHPVRCGPQQDLPPHMQKNRSADGEDQSFRDVPLTPMVPAMPSAPAIEPESPETRLAATTRVVPQHVHQARHNTTNVEVTKGYRPVWKDERLNPDRAERTLAAAQPRRPGVPTGYRPAWSDGRLNPLRGQGSAEGEAATDRIWTRTIPRELIPAPPAPPVSVASTEEDDVNSLVTRLSTRSAPVTQPEAPAAPAANSRTYVRVAGFASDEDARATARKLAATGMPMRLGTAKRKGQSYRVVLAGPFSDEGDARAALRRLRSSGFSGARLAR